MVSLVTRETSQRLGFNMQRLSGSRLAGTNLKTMSNSNTFITIDESPIPFDIDGLKELQNLQSNQVITMAKDIGEFKIINKK
jgi:hypothetical protein